MPFDGVHAALPGTVEWRRNPLAKRLSLRIDPRRGTVVVVLPALATRAHGRRFLLSQADWVQSRLDALPRAIAFAHDTAFLLHGRACRIRHLPHLPGTPLLVGRELRIGGGAERLAEQAMLFLHGEAHRSMAARVARKSRLARVRARQVRIRDPRTRWGSCAADGTLAFSWRLVMSPAFVQDYAAAHEVAHLRHMDHGPAFWALVRTLTPHRSRATAWLERRGAGLLRVG